MVAPVLPKPQAPVTDAGGFARMEWYEYFRLLVENGTITQEQFDDLVARVTALENAEPFDFTISGSMSVRVLGTPAGGVVQLTLEGDEEAPSETYYYGTDATGAKGFFPLAPGTGSISFNIGNGINVILPGVKGNVAEMPFNCTIERISLASRSGQVGSVVLDIWVTPLGSSPPTVADSIFTAGKPTIVSNNKYSDSTLTGVSVDLLEGDNVVFVVDSASVFTYLSGTIKVTKTS